jgi:putative Holliday junction resolvase
MKYLGIDYGLKRVGIAISDEDEKVAFARTVLTNDSLLLTEVESLCKGENIAGIVIGESNKLSGEPNDLMVHVREFAKDIENKTGLPVYFEPEFFTSAEAERLQGKNSMHDASAAAIILKSFLDKKTNAHNN